MRPVIFLALLTAAFLYMCIPTGIRLQIAEAYAQEDWKAEFEYVCSKTNDSPALTAEELNDLISRCDKLGAIIEQLDASQKRVYKRRLKMCADMFRFVLEAREKTR